MVKFRMAPPQMRNRRVSFMFHDKYAAPIAAETFAGVILLRQKLFCPDEHVTEKEWVEYAKNYMRRS